MKRGVGIENPQPGMLVWVVYLNEWRKGKILGPELPANATIVDDRTTVRIKMWGYGDGIIWRSPDGLAFRGWSRWTKFKAAWALRQATDKPTLEAAAKILNGEQI